MLRALLVLFILCISPMALSEGVRLGFIGDSISTGAGSDPKLVYDSLFFVDLLARGNDDVRSVPSAPAPQRLSPQIEFEANGMDWFFKNGLHRISRDYFDSAENSWGSQLGKSWNLPSDNILIAAENGARTQDFSALFGRLNASVEIPDKIFVLFTGNDFCALSADAIKDSKTYVDELRTGLEYMIRRGKDNGRQIDVFLLTPLRIFDLISAPSILQKKIVAFGKNTSCQELREKDFFISERPNRLPKDATVEETYLGSVLPPHMPGLCPVLFSNTKDKDKVVEALANRVRSLRSEFAALAQDLNKIATKGKRPFRFHALTSSSDIEFTGEDIANDCFHLSKTGHTRLAKSIFAEIGKI